MSMRRPTSLTALIALVIALGALGPSPACYAGFQDLMENDGNFWFFGRDFQLTRAPGSKMKLTYDKDQYNADEPWKWYAPGLKKQRGGTKENLLPMIDISDDRQLRINLSSFDGGARTLTIQFRFWQRHWDKGDKVPAAWRGSGMLKISNTGVTGIDLDTVIENAKLDPDKVNAMMLWFRIDQNPTTDQPADGGSVTFDSITVGPKDDRDE